MVEEMLTGEEMAHLDAIHGAAREIIASLKALNACQCEGATCEQCGIHLRLLRGVARDVSVTSSDRLHEAWVRVLKQARGDIGRWLVAA